METISLNLDMRASEIINDIRNKNLIIGQNSETLVERKHRDDKLEDLQERIFEVGAILNIMKEILAFHWKKGIIKYENEFKNTKEKKLFTDRLQSSIVRHIPELIKETMDARLK